jgi:DNA-binding beta-propeller fold protein YncE
VLSPDGSRLFVVITPDNTLEIFDVGVGGLTFSASVSVGMEPVAVAARSNDEVWVVNHLSDSISIVDLSRAVPGVVRTLLVGDEPRDLVFALPACVDQFDSGEPVEMSSSPNGLCDNDVFTVNSNTAANTLTAATTPIQI